MKVCYVPKQFREASLRQIDTANRIIEQYMAQGLRLTLRQLYYQCVAHHDLPNTEKSYKQLAALVSNARLAGLIDWDAIEDRGRVPDVPAQWNSINDIVEAAARSYRLPRWRGQPYYAELWVEKQALAGVLEPLAREHHVTLMVNKGYSSSSAMYESAKRFLAEEGDGAWHKPEADRRRLILLYLGDHDPSGEDMVRDIRDRMAIFGVTLDVRKLALTWEQIEEYDPPPNPAKTTDPRARVYIERHGEHSWEVDALDPNTLVGIVRKAFASVVDRKRMDAMVAKEAKDKAKLRKFVDRAAEEDSE